VSVHKIVHNYKAILIGGRYHKTEILLDHKMNCIEMYYPGKTGNELLSNENDKYEKCSIIKYQLLCGVPFQEIETFIYYVEE